MKPMNPSLEIEPQATRRRFSRAFWMLIAVGALLVVWTVAARPAGGAADESARGWAHGRAGPELR